MVSTGGGYPPIRDQMFTRKINFVKQNERNAATRGSGPEQTCSEKQKSFGPRANMFRKLKPPPLLVPAQAGEGSRISASGPILDPPKFRFSRFSKFQIFIVCVNATHGFHRQPRSKKTWQISMFFHVHANRTHVPSKIRRKTVLKVMKNMQSSTGTARAVGARAHNGNMGSEGVKFRYMSPRR